VRDGTRWIALLVPLEAVAFGAGVCGLLRAARAWVTPIAVLGVVLPLAALPDLAWGVGGRLEPASYPSSWASAREVVKDSTVPGDIVVLPFTAYRRPSWNHETPVFDPAGRFFDRTTVTNDELDVSGTTIKGEDPRAAVVGGILRGADVLGELPKEGIGIIVVDTEAPGAEEALDLVSGADELVVTGDELRVFTVTGASSTSATTRDRIAMTAAWIIAAMTLLGGIIAARLRSDRKTSKDRPRDVPES